MRASIQSGLSVSIVLKKDQRTDRLTNDIVRGILTKSPTHPLVASPTARLAA